MRGSWKNFSLKDFRLILLSLKVLKSREGEGFRKEGGDGEGR